MVAIPMLSGIVATEQAEFVDSYPLNLEPVPIDSKISRGQFRGAPGAVQIATGPGIDRGGIAWNGTCYRVMGDKLVSLSAANAIVQHGTVGGTGPVTLDYSYDRLGIRSDTALWYFDGESVVQVTDEDLGPVVDLIWIDGYWMTTDGTHVVVTELSDPTSVHPLKYGSAEEDPDPITGLIKLRGEPYVLGRYTIQVFRNVGGNGFPFQVMKGATIPFGCVGPLAKCLFSETFAFVGGARGEGLGVYIAGQGSARRISVPVLDRLLDALPDPTAVQLEARSWQGRQRLLVHLPEETWVFCAEATGVAELPVWYRARSGRGEPYRLRNAVLANGAMVVGDTASAALGTLSYDFTEHFGDDVEWRFDAGLLYNEGKGGIVHTVELIGLPGRGAAEGTAFLSMSRDGETFSVERGISMGRPGQRTKRMQWRPHTRFSNYLGFRFRGYGKALPGFARLEADIRPLAA